MKPRLFSTLAVGLTLFVLLVFAADPARATDRFITVASTTSTDQSGLFAHLLPEFERTTGIQVRIIALGTGQALEAGRRGDADVVFVHDQAAEAKFIADGHGVGRKRVMYNDFVLIGPSVDPAGVAGGQDILSALQKIESRRAMFVSRGDNSGTHAAELRYWKAAGIDPSTRKGSWYRELGAGMGAALNTAAAMSAYLLSDRATWLAFKNRAGLSILVEGDRQLFNQYGVMLVNPARHPHVRKEWAQLFVNWLVSPEGQSSIAGYRINGEQLFFPNATQ